MNSKIIFLEKLLGKCKYSQNTKEAEFYCCFCFHHRKKLSINLQTDQYKCWVCNKAGKNLIYLIKNVGTSLDVETYIKDYKAKDVIIRGYKDDFFNLKLPNDFIPLAESRNSIFGARAFKYLIDRGVSEDDVFKYKMGLSLNKRYDNRILLPSFNKDVFLNFFTGRFIGNSGMSYLDPDGLPKGYKKQVIFNELNIDWNKPVVLTEGFFDMVNATNAVPLFGSLLRKDHAVFQSIVKNKSTVFLAGDSDAVMKFQDIAKLFIRYDVEVYNVDIHPFKDVGQMTKKEFKLRYDAAVPVTNQSIFRQKLRAMC